MKKSPRRAFRFSFIKLLCIIGFFWLLVHLYMTTWTGFFSVANKKVIDIDIEKMIQDRLVDVMEKDLNKEEIEKIEDDDDDLDLNNLIENEEDDFDYDKTDVEADEEVETQRDEELEIIVPNQSDSSHLFSKPTLSPQIFDLHRRLNLSNPGHMGAGVVLPAVLELEIEKMLNQSLKKYQINEFVSSLVPLDRELPDIRTPQCRKIKYSDKLPVASIVMVYHNEALSMILRSIYSILNRTPENLLREIVLVDDCSSIGEL